MKRLMFYGFGFFLLTMTWGCEKDDPDPCPTYPKTEFRCKIDGRDYTPYCEPDIIFGCRAIHTQYYSDTRSFSIRTSNDKTNWGVVLRKWDLIIGSNVLITTNGGHVGNSNTPGNCGSYDLDTSKLNILTILDIDTIKSTLEGEFDFFVIDNYEECGKETLHITEGYFKVSY